MIDRKKYDKSIQILEKVNEHYNNEAINNAVKLVKQSRDEYELKVLFVGHYSAGKSSLINSFIERPEFLDVDRSPTTAIAAELRYSDEESAFSFDKDLKKKPLIDGKTYLPNEYDHVTYNLRSKGLHEIEDFVIVDTPGFDSFLEEHTMALASYLGYGIGFIMVVDVTKGDIDTSILNYLYEISEYSDNIVLLVNKCDKRIEEQINTVVEQIRNTLELNGFDYPVYTISRDDEEVISKITNVVSQIDAQQKYDDEIRNIIYVNAKNVLEILKVVSENNYLDTYEYDEIIRIQGRKKELAKKAFEAKRRELIDGLGNEVDEVINKIERALKAKSDEAAIAMENGSVEGLQAIVLNTLRPVLVESVKEFSIETVSEIAKSFEANYENVADEEEKGLDDIALDIADKIQGLIQSGSFVDNGNYQEKLSGEIDGKDSKKAGKGGNAIYTLVTAALSIVTGGTVTWMEAVIVLLPEIISGLKHLFGESNHSKLVKHYEITVIPQVTSAMWPTINESLENNIHKMIDVFENEMDNNVNSITKLIEDAMEKKSQSEKAYITFKEIIKEDISIINAMVEEYDE